MFLRRLRIVFIESKIYSRGKREKSTFFRIYYLSFGGFRVESRVVLCGMGDLGKFFCFS